MSTGHSRSRTAARSCARARGSVNMLCSAEVGSRHGRGQWSAAVIPYRHGHTDRPSRSRTANRNRPREDPLARADRGVRLYLGGRALHGHVVSPGLDARRRHQPGFPGNRGRDAARRHSGRRGRADPVWPRPRRSLSRDRARGAESQRRSARPPRRRSCHPAPSEHAAQARPRDEAAECPCARPFSADAPAGTASSFIEPYSPCPQEESLSWPIRGRNGRTRNAPG